MPATLAHGDNRVKVAFRMIRPILIRNDIQERSTAPARRYRYTYDQRAMDECWQHQTSVLLCEDCYDFAYTSAMPIALVECDATGEEL
jgi:hypothetical protein